MALVEIARGQRRVVSAPEAIAGGASSASMRNAVTCGFLSSGMKPSCPLTPIRRPSSVSRFTPGAALSEYEPFLVPMEGAPEGEELDLMALEASGVPTSQVQWGPPDESGPTYLHCLQLWDARTQAAWRFGPKPISFEDDPSR